MCGRLNIIDDPSVVDLCEQLGLQLPAPSPEFQNRFVRATDKVEIILQYKDRYFRVPATWWLLLDKHTEADGSIQFKPSKYTSFNTRYDKLNVPRSAGYKSFREKRCIVLVKGFGESQKTEEGMQYTDFKAEEGSCIALGGIYKVWQPGNVVSFSIITKPAHPKIERFHKKASPLILSQEKESILPWLDPRNSDYQGLQHYLDTFLPQNLIAQPIDKPSNYQPIAPAEAIAMD
jgi:putative SOS response-associated peptidase YedK